MHYLSMRLRRFTFSQNSLFLTIFITLTIKFFSVQTSLNQMLFQVQAPMLRTSANWVDFPKTHHSMNLKIMTLWGNCIDPKEVHTRGVLSSKAVKRELTLNPMTHWAFCSCKFHGLIEYFYSICLNLCVKFRECFLFSKIEYFVMSEFRW